MKKKLIIITVIAIIAVMATAGAAFAANVNAGAGGQRFASLVGEYETQEEFHEAVLTQKLAIIDAKLADGTITEEEAAAITEYLAACDGTCDMDGVNPNRPEEGWGIFGNGGAGGLGNGSKGGGAWVDGERPADCDGDGVRVLDGTGSGTMNGNGHRGGKN
ncbi:MAG: hypothetical protein R6W99_07670 [Clostridia bacterium]